MGDIISRYGSEVSPEGNYYSSPREQYQLPEGSEKWYPQAAIALSQRIGPVEWGKLDPTTQYELARSYWFSDYGYDPASSGSYVGGGTRPMVTPR